VFVERGVGQKELNPIQPTNKSGALGDTVSHDLIQWTIVDTALYEEAEAVLSQGQFPFGVDNRADSRINLAKPAVKGNRIGSRFV
jgi:hypothetical protein